MIDQSDRPAATVDFSERLRTPWWWYLGGLGVSLLLGGEVGSVLPGNWVFLPLVVVLLISVLFLLRLSSGRVTVSGGRLQAGERGIALTEIDRAIKLSPTELRRLVGRHGDPTSFVFIRSWIGPGVQVIPRDPADITPYWVVSSRHPERLLAALEAGSVRVS